MSMKINGNLRDCIVIFHFVNLIVFRRLFEHLNRENVILKIRYAVM